MHTCCSLWGFNARFDRFLEMYALFKLKLEWMTFKTNQGHWVVSLTLCPNLKVTINFMQIDQLLLQKCDICLLMYNLIWVEWISLFEFIWQAAIFFNVASVQIQVHLYYQIILCCLWQSCNVFTCTCFCNFN